MWQPQTQRSNAFREAPKHQQSAAEASSAEDAVDSPTNSMPRQTIPERKRVLIYYKFEFTLRNLTRDFLKLTRINAFNSRLTLTNCCNSAACASNRGTSRCSSAQTSKICESFASASSQQSGRISNALSHVGIASVSSNSMAGSLAHLTKKSFTSALTSVASCNSPAVAIIADICAKDKQ